MDKKRTFAVIGGDSRLYYAFLQLKKHGWEAVLSCMELPQARTDPPCAFEDAFAADTLLFGLPFTKDGKTLYAPFCGAQVPLTQLYERLTPRHTVFAGMISPAAAAAVKTTGAKCMDYFKDEPLTLYNAMLTAEALTGLLIAKLPCALCGAEIAVTGYGRIGFYLARMLRALGARVTVFARSPLQRAKAQTLGLNALPLQEAFTVRRYFHALINTVPAQILGEKELQALNADCLLIEAAGAPYGIDAAAAAKHGRFYLPAAGLPGKYAPQSAGELIADTVLRLEREVTEHAGT